jgi:YD repeat-containing protein
MHWNQLTTFTYDKSKSVPTQMTDPNNAVTNATYDEFGRILTIVRPGDDSSYPTIIMSYHETSAPFLDNPFWTGASQKRITGSTYFTVRKYYNGIGQLLQTQVVGATIGIYSRDILTDTFYDSGGRVYRQTVPYDVQTSYYYHPRSTSVAYTEANYDMLGRTLTS